MNMEMEEKASAQIVVNTCIAWKNIWRRILENIKNPVLRVMKNIPNYNLKHYMAKKHKTFAEPISRPVHFFRYTLSPGTCSEWSGQFRSYDHQVPLLYLSLQNWKINFIN